MSPSRIALLALVGAFVATAPACKPKVDPESPYQSTEIVWPPPPDPAVVRWTGHIANSNWSEPPSSFRRFMNRLSGQPTGTTFRKPYDVTTDRIGRVMVSDTGWGQVLVFDRSQDRFLFVGGSGQGALEKPAGITVDSRNHLFVADLTLGRVMEYGADLEFLRSYSGGNLVRPVGVAVVEERGELWVTDSKKHTIEVFDLQAQHLRTIGGPGTDPGQFNFPTHLATDKQGLIYVADTFNFRLQILDADGNVVRHWGKNCDSFGCFSRAKGISVDPDGNIYVVDAAFNNVQMFSPDGDLLMFFGGVGNGPGELWLPSGVHVDEKGQIFVVSQYNWRVNTYVYLGPPNRPQAEQQEGDN